MGLFGFIKSKSFFVKIYTNVSMYLYLLQEGTKTVLHELNHKIILHLFIKKFLPMKVLKYVQKLSIYL